jgi:hypothetical protein
MFDLTAIAGVFELKKSWLVSASGLDKDALHIYAGMALFLLVRLIFRGRGGWVIAWLAVVAMACGGEWLDLIAEGKAGVIQPDSAHWHDIWNTAFWPTILLLVSRWLPQGKARPATPSSGEDAERSLEQA